MMVRTSQIEAAFTNFNSVLSKMHTQGNDFVKSQVERVWDEMTSLQTAWHENVGSFLATTVNNHDVYFTGTERDIVFGYIIFDNGQTLADSWTFIGQSQTDRSFNINLESKHETFLKDIAKTIGSRMYSADEIADCDLSGSSL